MQYEESTEKAAAQPIHDALSQLATEQTKLIDLISKLRTRLTPVMQEEAPINAVSPEAPTSYGSSPVIVQLRDALGRTHEAQENVLKMLHLIEL